MRNLLILIIFCALALYGQPDLMERSIDEQRILKIKQAGIPPKPVKRSELNFHRGNGALTNYEFDRILSLSGLWKFKPGDNSEWSKPDFDDGQWSEIIVPSPWEDEGYPGYDGYGWYRRKFDMDYESDGKSIYLYLGYIDDVDQVFVNGYLAGYTGGFPPNTSERDHILRRYLIPSQYLNFHGPNTISVRVYDSRLKGGIVHGELGLFVNRNEVIMDNDLRGQWKFSIGDHRRWSKPEYDDSDWDEILVPGFWETQGYLLHDGYAWYRKHITIQSHLQSEELILILGRIDDYDEVFFNGKPIGGSEVDNVVGLEVNEWVRLRAYYIPGEYIDFIGDNTIAVKVYDGYAKGGIYDGPVGLMKRSSFLEKKAILLRHEVKDKLHRSRFQQLMYLLFGS